MGHLHTPSSYDRAFALGVLLNLGFVIVEAAAGWFADSLALLADAGHNMGDVLSLLIAWGGSYLAGREATARRTYGLRRSTILAALTNAIILLLAVGAISWEAVMRFSQPHEANGWVVISVAAVGFVINSLTALMFMRGRSADLNIRGAFLHMAADAAVSIGVVVAGVLILLTQWLWLDPLVSLMIVLVIAVSSWHLLRESLDLALDAVPASIDPDAIESYLAGLAEVSSVHHIHIWAMSTTEVALTAHLVKTDNSLDDAFLRRIHAELRDRFGIDHATLQLEAGVLDVECVVAKPESEAPHAH